MTSAHAGNIIPLGLIRTLNLKERMEDMTKSMLPSSVWDDFYDVTTIAPMLNDLPDAEIGLRFYNRGRTPFPTGFAEKLRAETDLMADLAPPKGFDQYMKQGVGHFVNDQTIQWLVNYRHDPSLTRITQDGGDLSWYAEGPLNQVWFEEIPPMVLISWLRTRELNLKPKKGWRDKLRRKADTMVNSGLRVVDYGTRRSFSREVHEQAIDDLEQYRVTGPTGGGFITTSNMHLAQKHNFPFSGTMGHKSAMAFAGVYGVQSANRMLMESWQRAYRGQLGTFLPDTYTTEVALRDFDSFYARVFDSIRHDSGDPFWFTDLIVNHYKMLKIDPMSKTVIFSDGLNIETALKIARYCEGKIKCAFGIGTNLTNDVGHLPLNIVIKLDKIRKDPDHPWIPVVKLSDTKGKISGDPEIARITRILLGI